MPNELSGVALDSRFFEVCWGWIHESSALMTGQWRTHIPGAIHIGCPPEVSTDANACEAWAMRWARENALHWRIDQHQNECRVELWRTHGGCWHVYGTDYKQAFVRACVEAGTVLLTNGEPKHGD